MFQYTNEKLRLLESKCIETQNKLNQFIEYDEELFWNENQINNYNNKNVLYIAFIGIFNNERIYKFGKSEQIYTREFKQHQKFFDIFKMKFVIECNNMSFVEKEFKKFLKSINLLKNIEIKENNLTELFTIKEKQNIDYVIHNLIKLVDENPLPIVKNLKDDIKHKNEEIQNLKEELNKFKINYDILLEKYKNIKINHIENKEINEIIEEDKYQEKNIVENDTDDNIDDNIDNNIENDTEENTDDDTSITEDFCINDLVKEKLDKNIAENNIDIFESNIPETKKYKNKDIDLFCDKYIEAGEDSKKSYCRLPVMKLYNFYYSLFYKPMSKPKFNNYIKEKYNVISKKIHNNYIIKQNWINIKIKNVKINIEPIEVMMKLFIEKYCDIDEKLFITSRVFNKVFKVFCEKNNFTTTKQNGWSEKKCVKILDNLGYTFSYDIYYQSSYKGIKIKSKYLTS